jgi:hypothetical protein
VINGYGNLKHRWRLGVRSGLACDPVHGWVAGRPRTSQLPRSTGYVKPNPPRRPRPVHLCPALSASTPPGAGALKACFSDEARAFGIDPPRGIMLTGVSGCGKTAISLAAAAASSGLSKMDSRRGGGGAFSNACSADRAAKSCTGHPPGQTPWPGSSSISRRVARVGQGP